MWWFRLIRYCISVFINNNYFIDDERFKREHKRRLNDIVINVDKRHNRHRHSNFSLTKQLEDEMISRRQDKGFFELVSMLPTYMSLYIKEQRLTSSFYYWTILHYLIVIRYLFMIHHHSSRRSSSSSSSDLDMRQHVVKQFIKLAFANPYGDMNQGPAILTVVILGVIGPAFVCRIVYLIRSLNNAWKNELTYIKVDMVSLNFEYLTKITISVKTYIELMFKLIIDGSLLDYDFESDSRVVAQNSILSKGFYIHLTPIDKYYYYNQFDYTEYINRYLEPKSTSNQTRIETSSAGNDQIRKNMIFSKLGKSLKQSFDWFRCLAESRIGFQAQPKNRISPNALAKMLAYATFNISYGIFVINIYATAMLLIKAKRLGFIKNPNVGDTKNLIDCLPMILSNSNLFDLALLVLDHYTIIWYYLNHLTDIDLFVYSTLILLSKLSQVENSINVIFDICEKYNIHKTHCDVSICKHQFYSRLSIKDGLESSDKLHSWSNVRHTSLNKFDKELEFHKQNPHDPLTSSFSTNDTLNLCNDSIMSPRISSDYIKTKSSYTEEQIKASHDDFSKSLRSSNFIDEFNSSLNKTIEWLFACQHDLQNLREKFTFMMSITGVCSIFVLSYVTSCFLKDNSLTPDEWTILLCVSITVFKSLVQLFIMGIITENKVRFF